MNAIELRVGNFVYKEYYDQNIMTGRDFHTVSGNDIAALEIDGFIEHNDERLIPIPITKDQLIDTFGFMNDGDEFWIEYAVSNNKSFHEYFELTYMGEGKYQIRDYGINIMTIHHLQNLYFALTGEEL